MVEKQLRLPIDDNFQDAIGVIRSTELDIHSEWLIFCSYGQLKLGIRTHYYDTNYSYLLNITYETAIKLLKLEEVSISEYNNALTRYKQKRA